MQENLGKGRIESLYEGVKERKTELVILAFILIFVLILLARHLLAGNVPPVAHMDILSGDSADARITIHVNATDADGYVKNYSLIIEGGEKGRWHYINESRVVMSGLREGDYDVILEVYDDKEAVSVYHSNFSIRKPKMNKPPYARIVRVLPEEAKYGHEVLMEGYGYDEDGWFWFSWFSNIDGYLGNGKYLNISNLSVGQHSITLRVVDNNGSYSEDYTTVVINPKKSPRAIIGYIKPNPANETEEIKFVGIGYDEDGKVSKCVWHSNIDGNISSTCNFTIQNLSVGKHEICFLVVDDDELRDEACVNLTISEIPRPVSRIISVYPNPATPKDVVHFTGEGSSMAGGITTYYWSSDLQGYLSSEAVFMKTGLRVGRHRVCLEIKDVSNTWSRPACVILEVKPDSIYAPIYR